MRTLLTEMRRKQTVDKTFQAMGRQGIQTNDLLDKFRELGINPITLREGYAAKHMPSLTKILQTVDKSGKPSVIVELYYQKRK